MRLVADNCPGCGAKVQVDADAEQVQCKYCSATFRLSDAGAARRVAEFRAGKKAPLPSSAQWLIPAVIVAVAGIAIAGIAIVVSLSRSPSPAAPPAQGGTVSAAHATVAALGAAEARPSWLANQQAILVDVSGDGVRDPIGWARYYQSPGTPQHFVALDATTGKQLWQSDAFSPNSYSDVRIAHLGELLVVADAAGLLRGIATSSGKTVWSTPLGERARRFCNKTEGGVIVDLEDDRALEVTLATGSLTPRGAVDRRDLTCQTLRSGGVGEDPDVLVASPSTLFGGRAELEGLDTYRLLIAAHSPLAFALGVKKPGSPQPTVAAFARPASLPKPGGQGAYTAVWKSAVAGAGPLAAAESSPGIAWYDDNRLFVPYSTPATPSVQHLVALDGATGKGLYDVVLGGVEGGRLSGLTGSDSRLYVTHDKGLDAFNAKDGTHVAHLSD